VQQAHCSAAHVGILDKAVDVVQKQSDAFREYLHVAHLCHVALISIPASKDKCVRDALATAVRKRLGGSVLKKLHEFGAWLIDLLDSE
jgi:hypothetical protein